MKTSALKFAAVAAMVCGFAAVAAAGWEYDPEAGTISDGNWTFEVKSWGASSFTTKYTADMAALPSGSGVLDIDQAVKDLGKNWTLEGGWISNKAKSTFAGMKAITEVVLPDYVTTLPYAAFNGCSGLIKVTAKSGMITSYGNSAFGGCTSLTTFDPDILPGGNVTKYDQSAFSGCSALQKTIKLTTQSSITFGYTSFPNCGLTGLDMSETSGQFSYNGSIYNNPNFVWFSAAPNMTTFPGKVGSGSFNTVVDWHWTGLCPTTIMNQDSRIFGDPEMDPAWNNETIGGVTFAAPSTADIDMYVSKYSSVPREEAEATVVGVKTVNAGKSQYVYLVREVSKFSPENATRGSLMIADEPAGCGKASPAMTAMWKRFSLDADGATQICTADATVMVGDERYLLRGYRLAKWENGTWGAATDYLGETSYTYTQGDDTYKLTWVYGKDETYPVSATITRPESGTVTLSPSVTGDYVKGTEVTATATPAAGFAFAYWRGTLPPGIDKAAPSVTFEVQGPYALEAVCTNVAGWYAYPAAAPEVVTDGNWAFAVEEWKDGASSFKTIKAAAGYLSGEGVLDLAAAEASLGRTWTQQGQWVSGGQVGQFKGVTTITEVVMPTWVTTFVNGAFMGCTNLRKVTVPSGTITSYGAYAFNGCSALEEFGPEPLPGGAVTSFGEQCFGGTSKLNVPLKLTVKGNVTFGYICFGNTCGFTELDVSGITGTFTQNSSFNMTKLVKVVYQPTATTLQDFGSPIQVYITGICPETISKDICDGTAYKVRFFVDPDVDEAWAGDTVGGFKVNPITDADRANPYYTEYGLDKEQLLGTITLDKADGTGTRKVWLVKWVSPFRKRGLMVIIR